MLLICNLIFNQLNIISANTYKIRFNDDGYNHLNELVVKNNYSKFYVLVDENTKKLCLTRFRTKTSFEFEIIEMDKKKSPNYIQPHTIHQIIRR